MTMSDSGRRRRPSHRDEKRLSLLVVSSSPEDAEQVRGMLRETQWSVHSAWSLQHALAVLNDHPIAVVICERDLPDGCWRDLLYAPPRADRGALLIVTSGLADSWLWTEVLNAGGFDVIPKPFCQRDVTWVLASATRQHQQQSQRARHAKA